MTYKNLKLAERFGYFKVISAVCVGVILVEAIATCAVILKPTGEIEFTPGYATNINEDVKAKDAGNDVKLTIAEVYRAGLFKSSGTVGSQPLADKTVDRIKSKLRLQCVMSMGGEQVAYIYIEGLGLKKCKVGDSVEDMFSVLDIAKGMVEISIIGHKVMLKC